MAKKVKCSEINEAIAELALDLAAMPENTDLDAVVASMNKLVGDRVNRSAVVEAVDQFTKFEAAKNKNALKEQLSKFKQEVKDDKAINFAIDNLQGQLETGFFQGSAPRDATSAASATIKQLRKKRNKLTTEKRLSERKTVVEKQIAEGKIEPAKPKEVIDKGDPFDRLRAELKEINAQLNQHREIKDLETQLRTLVFKGPKTRRAEALSEARRRNQVKLDALRFEVRQKMEEMRPKTKMERVIDVLGVPRAIMSSTDLSALGLQGWFNAVGHPLVASKSLAESVAAMWNRMKAIDIQNEITSDPMYETYKDAGGYLAPVEGGSLNSREEVFQSNLAEKIPGLGRIIKASSRGYVTFLNGLRFSVWKQMMRSIPFDDPKVAAKQFAKFTNIATGRGTLGKKGDLAVPYLNTLLFSVRNWASRFQLLAGNPMWAGDKQTRKIIAKEYAKFLAGSALLMLLGKLIGGELEPDPRGGGFGKIRFGDTTVDLTAQLGAELSFISKLVTKTIKTRDGKYVPLVDYSFGKDDRGQKMLAEKARAKLSPIASYMADYLTGKDFEDRPFSPVGGAIERFIPLSAQEVFEHFKTQDIPTASLLTALSFFGFRPSTFNAEKHKKEMDAIRKAHKQAK